MNLIATEIVSLLRDHEYGYPVSVVRGFNAADKVFPRIVVHQITDSTLMRSTMRDGDAVSALAFQIDIYTQDAVNGQGEVIGRNELSDDIAQQVDEIMFEQYRMNRDEVTDLYLYTNDTARRVMRYSCAIDPSGYTYRGAPASFTGYSYRNRF